MTRLVRLTRDSSLLLGLNMFAPDLDVFFCLGGIH